MDKYTGKRLDGRYEIHELIGIGGMAVVYRAYDTIDDRTVAIKILKDEFLSNEDFIRRFKNESKAIAVLSHPNIVKVYDVSFGDRIQYIVEEFIDGITLKEYLDQQKEIKWKEAIHFTIQILCALQHAHEKGVVHRDIKPQNIMMRQDGTIKVTDFGIARFSHSKTYTMTGKAIGSVHYIAPEQARGDLTDEKADIYSVGVMLYEMITGQLPFEADSAVSVAIMQLQSDPKRPKEINDSIPCGLEEITLKAMQKNPKQRYQFAAEMLSDIEAFRKNPSISFQYEYFIDDKPTKYIDAIDTVKGTEQPAYNDNYEYEEEPRKGRKKKKKSTATLVIAGIASAFFIVVIAFGAATLLHSFGKKVEEVPLPDFVGKTLAEVRDDKTYKDFKFSTKTKYDVTKKTGIILNQTPKAGIQVKITAEVNLTVNGGGKTVPIPNILNKSQEEALDALKKLKLKYKVLPVVDDKVAKGYVKDTDPAVGTQAIEGSTVIKVYVSTGSGTEKATIPNVIGKNIDDAKVNIVAAGLTVGEITKVDSNKQMNIVIETSPLPTVQVVKGSKVAIVISSGKQVEKTISVPVLLPKQITHDIVLKAYLGSELLQEKTVNPSYNDVYQLTFTGTNGKKQLIVQLDGSKYKVFILDFDTGVPTQTESYPYAENGVDSDVSSGTITPSDG